jgi:3-hydroxyisobutyrate dehydrogenase-like beta-hydroxyacid dehydrogenase
MIGLGRMGGNIIRPLTRNGHHLEVFFRRHDGRLVHNVQSSPMPATTGPQLIVM